MSEATKNKYTLETLLPLNVSYDRDHILRQQDVDMVNRLVEVIEGSRLRSETGCVMLTETEISTDTRCSNLISYLRHHCQ